MLNAFAYRGIGNLRQAFTQYEQLQAVVPDRADILINMASICVEMGDKAQAVALLERVTKVKPSAQIYMPLGIFCDEIGQHQQAQAYGGKVIDHYPIGPASSRDSPLAGHRGFIADGLCRKNQFAEAGRMVERGVC